MNEQKQINKEVKDILKIHAEHLAVANNEMCIIKNDVAWIKRIIERHDILLWSILSTVILGVIISLWK